MAHLRTLAILFASIIISFSTVAQKAQVDTIDVPTTHLKSLARCTVVLPESYNDNDSTLFPVVYLLHGHGGDYSSWIKITEPRLDSLATHYNTILVCPDGHNSWYWDSPMIPGLQMESYIITELVPYIDSQYRTIADAKHRAVTGYSMGGHGSLWLTMRHPDIFGSCGSMSGGVNINKSKWAKSWNMAESIGSQTDYPQRWIDYTAISLVPKLTVNQINIIIDCGVDDFFIGVNRELHEALLENKIPHDYTERPGRHTHSYWRNSLHYHLLYFNSIFNK